MPISSLQRYLPYLVMSFLHNHYHGGIKLQNFCLRIPILSLLIYLPYMVIEVTLPFKGIDLFGYVSDIIFSVKILPSPLGLGADLMLVILPWHFCANLAHNLFAYMLKPRRSYYIPLCFAFSIGCIVDMPQWSCWLLSFFQRRLEVWPPQYLNCLLVAPVIRIWCLGEYWLLVVPLSLLKLLHL